MADLDTSPAVQGVTDPVAVAERIAACLRAGLEQSPHVVGLSPNTTALILSYMDAARAMLAAAIERDELARQSDAALALATQTAEVNERLRSVLRRVEWEGSWDRCPCCCGAPPKHITGCELAAALLSDLKTDTDGGGTREDRVEKLEDALRDIDKWSQAYPLKVFPEADDAYLAKAHAALQQHGMGIDRISASAMRHVVEGVGKIARRALATETGGRDE